MLIINEELLAIEEAIDDLVVAFLNLPEVENFRFKRQQFNESQDLQEALKDFQNQKKAYQELEAYAQYRSDIKDMKRQLLRQKRELDVDPLVQSYKEAEVDLQKIMATMSQELSQAISRQIFVDTGLPLAPHKPPHQHGKKTNIKEKYDDV